MDKLWRTLTSRKFLVTVVTVLVNLVGETVGLDANTQEQITLALIAYIVAQGWADSGKATPADH
jgi:hypothetical protein